MLVNIINMDLGTRASMPYMSRYTTLYSRKRTQIYVTVTNICISTRLHLFPQN